MHKQKGFTLVEVLISLLIMSVGILAWSLAQDTNIRGRSFSNKMTVALELAESSLDETAEEVSSRSFDDGDLDDNSTITMDQIPFTVIRSVAAQNRMVSGGNSVWNIDVEVRWNYFGPHSVSLNRIVFGR